MTALRALAFAALAACACACPRATTAPAHAAATADPAPGLRPLAEARGLLLGAAVTAGQLRDEDFARTLAENFDYLTPENATKWPAIHPSPDQYHFEEADQIVAFARAHGMAVRGHTLVWHSDAPSWLDVLGPHDEGEQIMREHIATVVGHFKGQVRDWDVVNEPLDHDGQLRKSAWYLAVGPDYIEKAFRWAHQADPQARLFLNEYGNEAGGVKSDAFYALVKDLLGRGVPLHGVGLQFHMEDGSLPEPGEIARNMERLRALGIEVQITELDVRLAQPATPEALARQARFYAELARAALACKASALITWGLTDRFSWIPAYKPGWGGALLFDEDYRPKPAAAALREVLAGPAPKQ